MRVPFFSALLVGTALGTAQATPWQATASDQVQAALSEDAHTGSVCLNYDFGAVSGYAVLRSDWPQHWPAHFRLALELKGEGARGHDIQLKFNDTSGHNVWWIARPAMPLSREFQAHAFQPRHIGFAWGPSPDRTLRQTQGFELAVVAGLHAKGRKGSVCLRGLRLEPLAEPPPPAEPRLTQRPGLWQSDFGHARDFNGLLLRWGRQRPTAYVLEGSQNGRRWQALHRATQAGGALDTLYLPEQSWRHLRLRYRTGLPAPQVQLRSAAQWPDRNAMLAEQARALPRGHMPRAFLGEQSYWTLLGVDGGGTRSGLMGEDGAIELWPGGPSVEPVLRLDGRWITWADVQLSQSLPKGSVPHPIVQWQHPLFEMRIEAGADGSAQSPALLALYTLHNPGTQPREVELAWVLRPWQVNPPQQFLSTPGGAATLPSLLWDGTALHLERLALRPTQTPQHVQALPLAGGLALDALARAPALHALQDPGALPSTLLRFKLRLQAGQSTTLGWHSGGPPDVTGRLQAAAQTWQERLNRLHVQLPAPGERLTASLRSSLAHMLQSRDGALLRPGTRSYARAWVRDGAMMVAGLLRLGEQAAARDFVNLYQSFVFDSGKVPCCVDPRGADPVVENDSHGQYLFAVAEVWRHTQDRAFLQAHWPTVQKVLAWQEALRQSERMQPSRHFGLMPPSISHEGYSDKPAYSYWDNFWALRGYKDAVQMATALGEAALTARWTAWQNEFARELAASIEATAQHYGIAHIAGAADRGDFDATSTTVMLNPAQAQELAPERLRSTFQRYWAEAQERATGQRSWKDYTPYELRNVGALVRLGEVARAHALLDFFFQHQRPAGWQQWAEVVLPDARTPKFLGDMPHAWVSSDYARAVLDLLAYEREASGDLVLAAGIPTHWLDEGEVRVENLSTAWGRLSYRLARDGAGWRLDLLHTPERLPGRLRLRWNSTQRPQATAGTTWDGPELPLPAGTTTLLLLPP